MFQKCTTDINKVCYDDQVKAWCRKLHIFWLPSRQRQHHMKYPVTVSFPWDSEAHSTLGQKQLCPLGVNICCTRKLESLQFTQVSSCANAFTQTQLAPWACGEQLYLQTSSAPKSHWFLSPAASVPASYAFHDMFFIFLLPFQDHCQLCRLSHYERIRHTNKIVPDFNTLK